MSNFFNSIKGAASGLKNVATTYARDIVNEYMEGEGESDGENSPPKKTPEKAAKLQQDKDTKKQNAANFFSSFLPEIDTEAKPEGTPTKTKQSTNPFEAFRNSPEVNKSGSKSNKNISAKEEIKQTFESFDNKVEERVTTPTISGASKPISPKHEIKLQNSAPEVVQESNDQTQNIAVDFDKNLAPLKTPSVAIKPVVEDLRTIPNEEKYEKLVDIHKKLQSLLVLARGAKLPVMTDNNLVNIEAMPGIPEAPPSTSEGTTVQSTNMTQDESVSLIEGAMVKFDKFWSEVLDKYDKVVRSNMNPKVPDFERLFKSLDKPEKRHFKPFLKILAHSLQFLDKLETVESKMDALKEELRISTESQDLEKIKLLERQIIKLQNNCKDFINSEETMKRQLNYMQEKNAELDEDMNRAAKEILELKKQVKKLKEEKSQLSSSLNEANVQNDAEVVKEERDQLKKRVSELLKEIQDKDNTIEEMILKINELKETEMKYLDAWEDKQFMSKQLQDKEKDLELNKISLENLQTALQEQQESYEWTISELEKEKAEYEENIKRLEDSLQVIQGEMKTKTVDNTKVEQLEKENSQLSADIDQLIIQKEALSKELETTKDSLKTQELSKGNLVSGGVFNLYL